MKQTIGVIILIGLFGIVSMIDTNYTTNATIIEANDNTAIIEIYNGHQYEIGTTEQLKVGTKCKALMNTRGTDNVFTDDEVITIY